MGWVSFSITWSWKDQVMESPSHRNRNQNHTSRAYTAEILIPVLYSLQRSPGLALLYQRTFKNVKQTRIRQIDFSHITHTTESFDMQCNFPVFLKKAQHGFFLHIEEIIQGLEKKMRERVIKIQKNYAENMVGLPRR